MDKLTVYCRTASTGDCRWIRTDENRSINTFAFQAHSKGCSASTQGKGTSGNELPEHVRMGTRSFWLVGKVAMRPCMYARLFA